jgi:hypothetical protein
VKVGESGGTYSTRERDFQKRLADGGLTAGEGWVVVTDVPYEMKAVSVVIRWETGTTGGRVQFDTLVSPRM